MGELTGKIMGILAVLALVSVVIYGSILPSAKTKGTAVSTQITSTSTTAITGP